MNSLFIYLLELNVALLILFVAYRLFFEKDKNFVIRRIYLVGIMILSFALPLIPSTVRMAVNRFAPVSFNLEEVTIYAYTNSQSTTGSLSPATIIMIIYILMLCLGVGRLVFQLMGIAKAINNSERVTVEGKTVLLNTLFQASSFFGFIFMDPDTVRDNSVGHILKHEQVHRKEWHSVDRILVELFVMINWFNPVVWMYRKSVIENLEYLADSAVIRMGTDTKKYQLSILNQYIGSASITNQFSSQIKNRINMLNKDYKLGSSWKLALIFPLVFIAIIAISCSDKESLSTQKIDEPSEILNTEVENMIYYVVDEMPTLNGEDPVMPFRKHIAQNLIYPEQAKEKGISGKVIVKFVVRSDGTVEIPTKEEIASIEGISIDEVVVVAYRPLDDKAPALNESETALLKEEAQRVTLTSPHWGPGKVDGKPVDVMYTFPINFVLQ